MEIPYLGYAIEREGIKPDPQKMQGIMDLGRPSTTTKSRALIGMVNYYRNMLPGGHIYYLLWKRQLAALKVETYCEMAL